MRRALQFAGVTSAGLLAGNELGTLIGAHPALTALPLPAQIDAERALTARLGRVMPLFMTGTVASVVAAAVDRRGEPGARHAAAAAVASVLMLGITLAGNVPLNKRTLAYPSDGAAAEWRAIRRAWERRHGARVLLDLAALACLVTAVLEPGQTSHRGPRRRPRA